MKTTEQYFPVVLFIMLYKVVLPFEFVDEILKWLLSSTLHGAICFRLFTTRKFSEILHLGSLEAVFFF